MKIRIIVPGVYNDQNLEARTCKQGEGLETRPWYAQELIKLGYAEEFTPTAEELAAEAEAKAKAEQEKPKEEKPRAPRKAQPKNTFLG